MRQVYFFWFTLLCAGISQSHDEIDDFLVAFLRGLNKAPSTTTERHIDLKLDPYQEIDVKVSECNTANGKKGVCVAFYLCEMGTNAIIQDGHKWVDMGSIDECPKTLEICCLQNRVSNSSKLTKIEKEKQIVNTEETSILSLSEEIAVSSTDTPSAIAGKGGFSSPGVNVFSVGEGTSPSDRVYADFGEFPWMVAILKNTMSDLWEQSNYIAGGSLIHRSVVMTVAHKVENKKASDIKIRAGEYDTNSVDELYDHQERNVNKILVHPYYVRSSSYNNIGLLFLEDPVNLKDGPQIGIGCLAPPTPPPPGTICFSMGWGSKTFANKRVLASQLKKVKVSLVERATCERNLRKTRLDKLFKLHESLICTEGEDGIDGDGQGDEGSSLVCPLDKKESRFAIHGMVAYGKIYGGKSIAGLYVNVPNFYDWVNLQVTLEGLNPISYCI